MLGAEQENALSEVRTQLQAVQSELDMMPVARDEAPKALTEGSEAAGALQRSLEELKRLEVSTNNCSKHPRLRQGRGTKQELNQVIETIQAENSELQQPWKKSLVR